MDAEERRQWVEMQNSLTTLKTRLENIFEKLEAADRDRMALVETIKPLTFLEQKLEFHREQMHVWKNDMTKVFAEENSYLREMRERQAGLEQRIMALEYARQSAIAVIGATGSLLGIILGLAGDVIIRRFFG